MTSTRIVATVAATAVALTSLTACSGADEAGNQSTAASTETVVSTETVTSEQTSAPAPAGVGVANTGELPRAVTGYTDEARAEMAEDGLAEADVQAVVDAAHAGDAEVGGVTTDTGNSGGKASTSTSPRTAWCARPTGNPIAV